MPLSKDSEKCKMCINYHNCNNKRKELCAYYSKQAAPSIIVNTDTINADIIKAVENKLYRGLCAFRGGDN